MMKAVENKSEDILVRYDALCHSLNKNEVPILTITSQEQQEYPIRVNTWKVTLSLIDYLMGARILNAFLVMMTRKGKSFSSHLEFTQGNRMHLG